MIRHVRRLSLISVVWLAACTKGDPKFSDLPANQIPGPTFSGKLKASFIVTSAEVTIPVRGECDSRHQELLLRLAGLTPWQSVSSMTSGTSPLAASGMDTNCSDGRFEFSLKSLSELGLWDTSQSQIFTIEVRARTVAGLSSWSELQVTYQPGNGAFQRLRVTGGGAPISSQGYVARGAVVPFQNKVTSSPSYVLKPAVAE